MSTLQNHTSPCSSHAPVSWSYACMDDEVLVELSLDGYQEAFGELVNRYSDYFLRVAYKLVKSEHEAQDVVQSAFVNMFSKLHTFQLGSNFKSWAYRVVVNTGLMRLRKKKTRHEVELVEFGMMSQENQTHMSWLSVSPQVTQRPDEVLYANQLHAQIDEAVSQLPDKYHRVFILREYEHLSLQQIGEALDLSVPAVKSRLHRARHHLRASLERTVSL